MILLHDIKKICFTWVYNTDKKYFGISSSSSIMIKFCIQTSKKSNNFILVNIVYLNHFNFCFLVRSVKNIIEYRYKNIPLEKFE